MKLRKKIMENPSDEESKEIDALMSAYKEPEKK